MTRQINSKYHRTNRRILYQRVVGMHTATEQDHCRAGVDREGDKRQDHPYHGGDSSGPPWAAALSFHTDRGTRDSAVGPLRHSDFATIFSTILSEKADPLGDGPTVGSEGTSPNQPGQPGASEHDYRIPFFLRCKGGRARKARRMGLSSNASTSMAGCCLRWNSRRTSFSRTPSYRAFQRATSL